MEGGRALQKIGCREPREGKPEGERVESALGRSFAGAEPCTLEWAGAAPRTILPGSDTQLRPRRAQSLARPLASDRGSNTARLALRQVLPRRYWRCPQPTLFRSRVLERGESAGHGLPTWACVPFRAHHLSIGDLPAWTHSPALVRTGLLVVNTPTVANTSRPKRENARNAGQRSKDWSNDPLVASSARPRCKPRKK